MRCVVRPGKLHYKHAHNILDTLPTGARVLLWKQSKRVLHITLRAVCTYILYKITKQSDKTITCEITQTNANDQCFFCFDMSDHNLVRSSKEFYLPKDHPLHSLWTPDISFNLWRMSIDLTSRECSVACISLRFHHIVVRLIVVIHQ